MQLARGRQRRWTSAFLSGIWDERQVRLEEGLFEVVRMGEGRPLVLVPGLAGGWKLVAPLARRLARTHQVVMYGLRGDRFPLPVARTREVGDFARDLAHLIDHLGLEQPLVFGVSFGGAIALELATEYPEALGGLIVAGAEARFRANLGTMITRRVLERYPLPSNNRFLNQFVNLLFGGPPPSGGLAEFVVERCWETDQSEVAHRLRMLDGFDVTDRLWRVEVPTLVLAGSRDVVVPPARQEALAARIFGARFQVLEGAGHLGFLTHRGDVARSVKRMFGQLHDSRC